MAHRNMLRPIALVLPALALASGCSSPSTDSAPEPTHAAMLPPPPVSVVDGTASYAAQDEGSHAMAVGLYGESRTGVTLLGGAEGEGNLMQVSFAPEGGDFHPDIDRTASFLVYASKQHAQRFDIYRKSIEGRTVTQLTTDGADDIMPCLSPDGTLVAFASNRNGNWDVFVMPTEGGPASQITFEGDDEVQPTWSPDGRKLAFARMNQRTSRWEIWSASAMTPSSATYLTDGFLPRWCPAEGQSEQRSRLLFQRARQQGSRLYGIWTIDLVDGEAMHPTEIVSGLDEAIIQANWSPDGTHIVYTSVVSPGSHGSDLPAQSNLWTVSIDGTGRRALTSGPFRCMQPVWGTDDRIYFVSNRGGIENLWAVSPASETRSGEAGALAGAGEQSDASTHDAPASAVSTVPEAGAHEDAGSTAPSHANEH